MSLVLVLRRSAFRTGALIYLSRRLKGCSAPAPAVKGRLHRACSPISARRLCHADEAETAVHGCHCPGDMAVPMCWVLARPWIGVRVCHLLLLSFNLKVAPYSINIIYT